MKEGRKNFIKKPIYPGGSAAFKKFIADNLQYPEEALKNKIEGTVVLKYTIDHHGKVIESRIIKSLGYGCDEEAQRVIALLKFEIPKEPRKLRVQFHKESKLFFKMPAAKAPDKSSTRLNYTWVSKTKSEQKQSKPSKSYNYQIKL